MKTGLLSLLAGTALITGVAIAQASEGVILNDSQLDRIAAGGLNINATAATSLAAAGGQTSNASANGPANTTNANSGGGANGNIAFGATGLALSGTQTTISLTNP